MYTMSRILLLKIFIEPYLGHFDKIICFNLIWFHIIGINLYLTDYVSMYSENKWYDKNKT